MEEWISVKDRLPEKTKLVLTVTTNGYISINSIYYGVRWMNYDPIITHWLPIPEPPKGKEERQNGQI